MKARLCPSHSRRVGARRPEALKAVRPARVPLATSARNVGSPRLRESRKCFSIAGGYQPSGARTLAQSSRSRIATLAINVAGIKGGPLLDCHLTLA
jgi:hypothetical protein